MRDISAFSIVAIVALAGCGGGGGGSVTTGGDGQGPVVVTPAPREPFGEGV